MLSKLLPGRRQSLRLITNHKSGIFYHVRPSIQLSILILLLTPRREFLILTIDTHIWLVRGSALDIGTERHLYPCHYRIHHISKYVVTPFRDILAQTRNTKIALIKSDALIRILNITQSESIMAPILFDSRIMNDIVGQKTSFWDGRSLMCIYCVMLLLENDNNCHQMLQQERFTGFFRMFLDGKIEKSFIKERWILWLRWGVINIPF